MEILSVPLRFMLHAFCAPKRSMKSKPLMKMATYFVDWLFYREIFAPFSTICHINF